MDKKIIEELLNVDFSDVELVRKNYIEMYRYISLDIIKNDVIKIRLNDLAESMGFKISTMD